MVEAKCDPALQVVQVELDCLLWWPVGSECSDMHNGVHHGVRTMQVSQVVCCSALCFWTCVETVWYFCLAWCTGLHICVCVCWLLSPPPSQSLTCLDVDVCTAAVRTCLGCCSMPQLCFQPL